MILSDTITRIEHWLKQIMYKLRGSLKLDIMIIIRSEQFWYEKSPSNNQVVPADHQSVMEFQAEFESGEDVKIQHILVSSYS